MVKKSRRWQQGGILMMRAGSHTRAKQQGGGGPYRGRAGSHTRKHTQSQMKIERTIALTFIEMLNTIKLHHWKTMSFATHKATDELYSKLNDNIDTFVEIMLGKSGGRINLTNVRSIPVYDFNDEDTFKRKIESYRAFLTNLTLNSNIMHDNTDLFNVRDELLANLNQFMYLLTFS
jgi:hypothetical protein